uniref:Aldo-keto reductase family 1 member C1 homolog n=1 Tax=Marmota marmota marmota TaxID=9994 RepID=A0A8C5Z488_MARMA
RKLSQYKTTEATKIAIEAGFCHIDCAYAYQVEEEVGLAIRSEIADGTVKREDILYTSKLWSTFHRPELVQSFLKRSLKKLHFDYVDLYLIHIPTAMKPGEELYPKDENGKILYDSVDLCATWEAMEKCKDAGLARSIGVSNFNRRQLEMILNKPGLKYKPVCNQVECHVYHNQKKLLDFCKSKDIVLVAFGALGTQREKRWVDQSSPVLLDDPVLGALAKKHKRSPALIALRYQLQCGVVVPAKSFNENRIKENIQWHLCICFYFLKWEFGSGDFYFIRDDFILHFPQSSIYFNIHIFIHFEFFHLLTISICIVHLNGLFMFSFSSRSTFF